MDINELYQRLCKIEYYVSGKGTYNFLSYMHKQEEVHNIIMSWAAEQEIQNREKISEQEVEIAKLKAECYAYAKIIANSNFAPMLIKESEEQTMTTELKPCPFCGRAAILKQSPHIPKGTEYTPTCTEPSCAGRLTKIWTDKEKAINAWNKRAE